MKKKQNLLKKSIPSLKTAQFLNFLKNRDFLETLEFYLKKESIKIDSL